MYIVVSKGICHTCICRFWQRGWDPASVISVRVFGTIIMAGKYGYLKDFLPDEDSIETYLESVALYFKENGIEEDKQVPLLLSSIGVRTYSLLCDLVAPVVPGMLAFDRTSEVFTSHFQPRCLVIAERFHFHKWVQAMDESIAELDAAL